jgi:alkanesulfonate monooxygenase SsuD/methylene tetrahydromethanopterin reductase-like flavin-dependent oxidoreductase (luciferase family)
MPTPIAPTVRIGLFLLGARFPGRSSEQALATLPHYAATAEQHGFDEVFIAEHHFMPYGTCPSAITLAAALLGATRRIGIGTAVSVLSTTHPVALAEQAAMLSVLYPGRFTLGVGRGGPWVDLEVFGTGAAAHDEHFPESLQLLTRWLSGGHDGTLGWNGQRHTFRPVPIVPRPPQPPPVLLACTSLRSARLAAQLGLPMLLGMHATDQEKAQLIRVHGDPHAAHAALAVAHVADTREQALTTLRTAMPGWLRDGLAAHTRLDGTPHSTRDPVAYTEHLLSIHPVGDPDYCTVTLRASINTTGISRLLLFVEGSGDPESITRNIARLGRDVLPQLRQPDTTPADEPLTRCGRHRAS